MADKKKDCRCGSIPLKQNSERPARDLKKAEKSKLVEPGFCKIQVEHGTVLPRGMGIYEKISVTISIFRFQGEFFFFIQRHTHHGIFKSFHFKGLDVYLLEAFGHFAGWSPKKRR